MLRENVHLVNGVLFTHEHSDHTAGLDDLRPFCYKIGEMPIFLSQRTFDSLEQRFQYIFSQENRYPGAPSVQPNIIDKTPFSFLGLTITPIQVMHGNLAILGYRIQNIAYLTDVKTITIEEKEKLRNLDVLIVNALRIEEHPTHFNLKEALNFIEEIQPKRAYFTHISHKLGFHKEVSAKLPKNVFLSFDGLEIEV